MSSKSCKLLKINLFLFLIDNGFCDTEIEDTRSPNRGRFLWEETVVGMTTRFECPFGPSGEVGTRTCLNRHIWGASEITSCGTEVSLLFKTLNSSLSQVTCYYLLCISNCIFSRSISQLIM